MSVRVTDNSPHVKLTMNQRASVFVRLMMDEAHRQSVPITPKKSGRLRSDVLKRAQGKRGVMEWRKGYAGPQERGIVGGRYPVRNYTTAGTGPKFAQKGVLKGVNRTQQIAKRARLA